MRTGGEQSQWHAPAEPAQSTGFAHHYFPMNINLSEWTQVAYNRQSGSEPLVSYLNRNKSRGTGLVSFNRQAVELLGLKHGDHLLIMQRPKEPLNLLLLVKDSGGSKITIGKSSAKVTGGSFYAATGGKYATVRWRPQLVKIDGLRDGKAVLLTAIESEKKAA
jgi:hypothetical protein